MPAQAETVYKWVDQNGVTNYTTTPPQPASARTVATINATPAVETRYEPAPGSEGRCIGARRRERETADSHSAQTTGCNGKPGAAGMAHPPGTGLALRRGSAPRCREPAPPGSAPTNRCSIAPQLFVGRRRRLCAGGYSACIAPARVDFPSNRLSAARLTLGHQPHSRGALAWHLQSDSWRLHAGYGSDPDGAAQHAARALAGC